MVMVMVVVAVVVGDRVAHQVAVDLVYPLLERIDDVREGLVGILSIQLVVRQLQGV